MSERHHVGHAWRVRAAGRKGSAVALRHDHAGSRNASSAVANFNSDQELLGGTRLVQRLSTRQDALEGLERRAAMALVLAEQRAEDASASVQ
jgi:hypothetical protein